MKAEHRAAEHLASLYAVVAGLALTVAVTTVINVEAGALQLRAETILGGLALVVTLVPFYHGGLLHLDKTYSTEDDVSISVILVDFVVLFLEACVFLAAAVLVTDPVGLIWALVILWLLDIAWVVTSWCADVDIETDWAKVNAAAVASFFTTLVLVGNFNIGDTWLFVIIFVIALSRTVFDYRLSRDFYFPSKYPGVSDKS